MLHDVDAGVVVVAFVVNKICLAAAAVVCSKRVCVCALFK